MSLAFSRIIKRPDLGGKYHEWNLFIPTSWSAPSMRTKGPGDVDRTRIQAFIEEANGLIEDQERREAAGFKLQEPDFKFQRFPDWAISRPLLSDKELSVSRFETCFSSYSSSLHVLDADYSLRCRI